MTTRHCVECLPTHTYKATKLWDRWRMSGRNDIITKTHREELPGDLTQWHLVHVWRRNSFAQFCSAVIMQRTGEYIQYNSDNDLGATRISSSVMCAWIEQQRQYDLWLHSAKTHCWGAVTTLQYEQIVKQPNHLCRIVGTKPQVVTPRSHRDPQDYIVNYKQLRKLYRAKFSDHIITQDLDVKYTHT